MVSSVIQSHICVQPHEVFQVDSVPGILRSGAIPAAAPLVSCGKQGLETRSAYFMEMMAQDCERTEIYFPSFY